MYLPRELGSSVHDTWDVECRVRADDDPIVEAALCVVCLNAVKEEADEYAGMAIFREPIRELGS